MYKRLYSFIELHNILYSMPFGLRTSHSINQALIGMAERIKESLDNRRFGGGIDFQKGLNGPFHVKRVTMLAVYFSF